MDPHEGIKTPDNRLRVFVSSTLEELAAERRAVRDAVLALRLNPVMFETAAQPHPPREVYQAYLAESQLFIGVYWQRSGWSPGDGGVSGVEDEYRLAADLPKLVYVKVPAPERDPRLDEMLAGIREDARVSYRQFHNAGELRRMVRDDIALLLSERFETTEPTPVAEQATVPAPATPLLGRDDEVGQIKGLLTDSGVRLVTLTGPGGVGKTRLATELATMLGGTFNDGVRFVELSTVTTPDLVGAALAQALGLHTTVDHPPIDDVESYLRSRTLLLVIDNFEQVAEAAPVISRLLSAAPGVSALVTSRSPLRLTGEHTVEVPPLPLPVPGDDYSDARTGAVRLFVDRARAAKHDFVMTPENTKAVIEICRRLDGLPLAIELAAAKVRVLPPPALLERIRHGAGGLGSGARDLPVRQRTLRSTIAWSFDLLTPTQQRLFARLGMFAGGIDLAAVDAIGGADSFDALDALVDSSLVKQEIRDGESRYRMLDSIREYALERLRDCGEWHEAHVAYAGYFLALARRLEPRLGVDPGAVEQLETEHDNLNASMNWFIDEEEYEHAIRLSWAIWMFWWLHGHIEESVRYMTQIDEGADLPEKEMAYLLVGTGATAFVSGDLDRSERDMTAARPTLRELGDDRNLGLVNGVLGTIAMRRDEYDRARELLEETRRLGEKSGADWMASLYYSRMGMISLTQGDTEAAAEIFMAGLQSARRSHDRLGTVTDLYSLAVTAMADDDLNAAERFLQEGLTSSAEVSDRGSVAFCLEALADLCARRDQRARSVRLAAASRGLRTQSSAVWLRAFVPDWPGGRVDIAALRAELGEEAFGYAWAQGSADDISSAVAFALQAPHG